MPKVSIIVPIYNSENSLERCLNSIINQTLNDIEIICINNNSTDNSLEIVQRYSDNDERIKIIDLKENKDYAYAKNMGLETAKGDYIGFVNSEDFIELDFYEKLYNKALNTDADAVKGEPWMLNDNETIPVLKKENNINRLIQNNFAWFCSIPVCAVYKRCFLIEKNIKFAFGLDYTEDNSFCINAILNYKKVETVNNAKYYYTANLNKKEHTNETICSFNNVIEKILNLINSFDFTKEQYLIIFSYILNQTLEMFELYKNTDLHNQIFSTIKYLNNNCKYNDEIITSYIKYKHKIDENNANELKIAQVKEGQINKLIPLEKRILKQYNEYSKFLTKTVKILVSYIKPSFLFKSDILTPIHLGRDVAFENSKDGIISEDDLQWLKENCIGDNDFDGNISSVNRKVGFLTGTWFAYKNYKKLGDPDYIGSFAYRRLLSPSVLFILGNYDLILPKKDSCMPNIKEQFCYAHSKKHWQIIKDVINRIHPEDNDLFETFGHENSIHFFEIYIMKKNLFFDFCAWIFPMLFELLNIPDEEMNFTKEERTEIINWFKEYENPEICNDKNFEIYQKRLAGFMIERLTAFYFYKQELNPDIKIWQTDLINTEEK